MRNSRRRQAGMVWAAAVVCSALAAFTICCAATGGTPAAIAAEKEIEMVPANLTGLNYRAVPAGHYIFDSSGEWEEFWEKHSEEPAPEFDFNKFALLAVFLGQKPNPGYSVKIVGAEEKADETVVKLVEYLPDAQMMYAQVIVYPSDAVLIPRTDKVIRFAVSKKSGRP